MNTRAKGKRNLLRAKRLLEEQGYLVDSVEKSGLYCKERDLFGIGDLVAINHDHLVIVQVTSNKPHTATLYRDFALKYPCVKVMQIIWKDRIKEPRIISY